MTTLRRVKWNGEYWYRDADAMVKRARRWIVWVGGWERPVRSADPNGMVVSSHVWKPCLWRHHGQGVRAFPRNLADSLTPVSLFGHRVTFFGWGFQLRPSHRRSIFMVSRSGVRKGKPTKVYVSPDGTPSRATLWLRGAP